MRALIITALLLLFPLSGIAGELEDWLIEAAEAGNLSGVRSLIARGAYVHARDAEGWTALMYAAYHHHTDIVLALLYAGAHANAETEGWSEPMIKVVIQAYIANGTDVKSEWGAENLIGAAQEGYKDIVQVLINAGADVNAKRANDGETALKMATWWGRTAVVALLKKAGARE